MNNRLVKILAVASFLIPTVQASEINQLSDSEIEQGWVLLFDGETLFGWQAGSEVNWKVEDGAIVATEGTMGLLYTLSEFTDFQLKIDFLADKGTNSGVFLRTAPVCQDPGPGGECYELNIAPPDNPFPTGSFVQQKKARIVGESDSWRSYDILVQSGDITVLLDGEEVMDLQDSNPLGRGHIGIQFNQGKISFRNIKLRPIGLKPLLNGKDLANWNIFPGKKSTFSITDEGELHIEDGPGQIETKSKFSDFVFQAKIKVNGEHLNSGIFFRNMPGEWWRGYESQIRNEFEDGDPARPVDFGTGGVYNRSPARMVVSEDFKWFTKTIVCNGPNISVWVNGFPVTAWTDNRPPSDNPREGLRTEAGTITLQGHDPTTDLLFRDLVASELGKRERR